MIRIAVNVKIHHDDYGYRMTNTEYLVIKLFGSVFPFLKAENPYFPQVLYRLYDENIC